MSSSPSDLPTPGSPQTHTSDEASFWDDRAGGGEYRGRLAITPSAYMEAEPWLQAWAPLLPPLQGKRVLDCGSGLGSIAAWMALQGGDVIGFDLSWGMARLATEYATKHGAKVDMISSTFEELPLADHSIDVAVGQYILHHTDLDKTSAQLQRVVKPGGVALFVENMALNPLIARYVRSQLFEQGVMREGSPDECPILPETVEMMRGRCRELRLHWPSFVFNEILFSRLPIVPRKLGQWIDDGIYRVIRGNPSLLKNSYFAVVEMRF